MFYLRSLNLLQPTQRVLLLVKGDNQKTCCSPTQSKLEMSAVRIGFIGAGKMATALARGIVSQGQILSRPQDLMASCPPQDAALLAPIKELGCVTSHDNLEVVANADLVILAVKPAVINRVLSETKALLDSTKILTSIAAGIKIGQMEDMLLPEAKVIKNSIIFNFIRLPGGF